MESWKKTAVKNDRHFWALLEDRPDEHPLKDEILAYIAHIYKVEPIEVVALYDSQRS